MIKNKVTIRGAPNDALIILIPRLISFHGATTWDARPFLRALRFEGTFGLWMKGKKKEMI